MSRPPIAAPTGPAPPAQPPHPGLDAQAHASDTRPNDRRTHAPATHPHPRRRPRLAAALALALSATALAACGATSGSGHGQAANAHAAPPYNAVDPIEAAAQNHRPSASEPSVGLPELAAISVPRAQDVPRDPEEQLAAAPSDGRPSPGAPSDAEIRAELKHLGPGEAAHAYVDAAGQAIAPSGAPDVVKRMIAAGNAISRLPYIWGGGHARVFDKGYDCSGSLSFAMIQAGLLAQPLAGGFGTMGQAGPGKWMSIYSNSGHVFAVIAGLRFDTSALHIAGSRWTTDSRPIGGFVVRHLPGL